MREAVPWALFSSSSPLGAPGPVGEPSARASLGITCPLTTAVLPGAGPSLPGLIPMCDSCTDCLMSVAHAHPRLLSQVEISLGNAVGSDASCLASCPPHSLIHLGAGERKVQARRERCDRPVGQRTTAVRVGGGPRLCAPAPPHIWSSSCTLWASGWASCPTPSTGCPSAPRGPAAFAPPAATAAAPGIRPAPRRRAARAASATDC